LVSAIKAVPSQMLAARTSDGASITVGAFMRNNLATYRNLTPQVSVQGYVKRDLLASKET